MKSSHPQHSEPFEPAVFTGALNTLGSWPQPRAPSAKAHACCRVGERETVTLSILSKLRAFVTAAPRTGEPELVRVAAPGACNTQDLLITLKPFISTFDFVVSCGLQPRGLKRRSWCASPRPGRAERAAATRRRTACCRTQGRFCRQSRTAAAAAAGRACSWTWGCSTTGAAAVRTPVTLPCRSRSPSGVCSTRCTSCGFKSISL